MTALVQAALTVRRGARATFGYATACALGALVCLGAYRPDAPPGPAAALTAAVWALVFAVRASERLRLGRASGGSAATSSSVEPADRPQRVAASARAGLDLELGALMLVGLHALLQTTGGLLSPLYPVLYVFVAFATSFAERASARLLVVLSIALEAVLYFVTEGHSDPRPFLLHAGFLALFGLLNLIFTSVEISRVRQQNRRELRDEQERVRADARLFRLVTPSQSEVKDDERLFRSSIEEVREAQLFNLCLLHRTLGLHTCALLMLDDEATTLRIAELVTDSDGIAEGPFPAGTGAVGAAIKRGLIMNLEHMRPGYRGLCYYRGPARVCAFVAVPVIEGGQVRGVLCADRLEDRSFSPHEEETLKGAVHHLLRATENERIFLQLERAKREHTVLRRASEALGAALSAHDVLEAAFSAAAGIAHFDLAAVTRYDAKAAHHEVIAAVGQGASGLKGLSFRDNTSLCAMAVKNRHYLPYRGEFDAGSQVVFTRRAKLPPAASLLILPLLVRDEPIGTFTLCAERGQAFPPQVRPVLQVLANQMAVALANAASVARLEALATTDGLTGCYNKRYFLDELKSRLQAAQRFGRKVSLIITDIDHFKVVNDTYGHATGDVVIQQLGQLLRRLKRETDVVARFGGEEFCILCEETDSEGARKLAERVREELEATVFQTELGPLQVTCSLGVATFPQHAGEREALFDVADKALYAAKHGGRNRVAVGA